MNETQTETLLQEITATVHPLMAEALYLAAVPEWFDANRFAAIRWRDDNRTAGLIERLNRYSFINALDNLDSNTIAYAVHPAERNILQHQFLAQDPEAFRTAHVRALAYEKEHPDPNPFAHAQTMLYHLLLSDGGAGVDELIHLFRTYQNDRQLAAMSRLLQTAVSARHLLEHQQDDAFLTRFDNLLDQMQARLAQYRGQWDKSLALLNDLITRPTVSDKLRPYVSRALGFSLLRTGSYVEAIERFRQALAQFQALVESEDAYGNMEAEVAYSHIALGNAHLELAISARGGFRSVDFARDSWLGRASDLFGFLISFPILIYLSFYFGFSVWKPAFWPVLRQMDWIIARLFAIGASHYRQADPLLEKHGTPAEWVAADERLAFLDLRLGNVEAAQKLFMQLLSEQEAPLSRYRQATVRVGLAETLLQVRQPSRAVEALEAALPELTAVQDADLEARAHELLAEARYDLHDAPAAVEAFARSLNSYMRQQNWTAATSIVSRLEAIQARGGLGEGLIERITAVTQTLPQRQYPIRFRHPWLILFRRLALLILALTVLFVPLVVIQFQNNLELTPEIAFRAIPIFDPDQSTVSNLTLGITSAIASSDIDGEVFLPLALGIVAGYATLSLIIGVLIIIFTPLRNVQAQGQAQTVYLTAERLTIGQGATAKTIHLPSVSLFVKADTKLWSLPFLDSSGFALGTKQKRLVVRGSIAWYAQLRQRIEAALPPNTQVIDLDYVALRNGLGLLYLINLLLLSCIALIARVNPPLLWEPIGFSAYSLANLYPYFYLGIFLLPAWTVVVRPMRVSIYLNPRSRAPYIMMVAGVLLFGIYWALRFRPLLTVPDIYPPLTVLVLLLSSTIAFWRARWQGEQMHPLWRRLLATALTLVLGSVMILLIIREVGAYHYLVYGHDERDFAADAPSNIERLEAIDAAIQWYDEAYFLSTQPILGVDPQQATGWLGLPAVRQATWHVALENRAALSTQIGEFETAVSDYTQLLQYSSNQAEIYTWRAIAWQGAGTTMMADGDMDTEEAAYQNAVADFNRAIELSPARADYRLWRGVAYHVLNDLDEAYAGYEEALLLERNARSPQADPLTDEQRERALTGQGWVRYVQRDFDAALTLFARATEANPSATEAWTGLGYAHYRLDQFDEAEDAWDNAVSLDPTDPDTLISMGTLHWKRGGLAADPAETCREYAQSADFFGRATDRQTLRPQTDEDVAFIYRTRGQLLWLLRNCDSYSHEGQLEAAIDSYGAAIDLDPTNPAYYQLRARLQYALWLRLPDTPEHDIWLYNALPDISVAFAADPDDETTQRFYRAITTAAFPRLTERAEGYLADGQFVVALPEFSLLAELQPEDAYLQFQTGLAALGSGDEQQAQLWVERGLALAQAQESGAALIEQIITQLEGLASTYADLEATAVLQQLEDGLNDSRSNSASVRFIEGLVALESGNIAAAQASYADALAIAAARGELQLVYQEVIRLRQSQLEAAPLWLIFEEAWPDLAAAAADESDTRAAFLLGITAVSLQNDVRAANWFNEGVRRAALNNQYDFVRSSRNQLLLSWADVPSNAASLMAEMDGQHEAFLAQHEGLADNQLYWRFRAWFKYGVGLSAFRLEDEAGALEALLAAIADGETAYALQEAGNELVYNYLPEGALGWYYRQRGDDQRAAGDLTNAYLDYARAVEAYAPANSELAFVEQIEAAFLAGLTAVLDGEDYNLAWLWYEFALTTADENLSSAAYDEVIETGLREFTAVVASDSTLADQPDIADIFELFEEAQAIED